MMLLVGWQEGHPACKKTEWWGAGMVICLERGAVLHMAQLMPLPLTVSCFSKIQIGFTFLVPAHLGNPWQRVVKRVCVCLLQLYINIFAVCHVNKLWVFAWSWSACSLPTTCNVLKMSVNPTHKKQTFQRNVYWNGPVSITVWCSIAAAQQIEMFFFFGTEAIVRFSYTVLIMKLGVGAVGYFRNKDTFNRFSVTELSQFWCLGAGHVSCCKTCHLGSVTEVYHT